MRCNRIQDESLSSRKMELLYGEADAKTRAEVEAHLDECPACRDEMASFRRLRRDLRAWTLEQRRPSTSTVRPRRLPVWLASAAALAVGIGVGSAIALLGDASLRRDLTAMEARSVEREQRYRAEVARLRAALDRRPADLDADALLARVDQRLENTIRRSERTQDERLDNVFTDWEARMEAQRRVDLARVAAGLSYLDGQYGEQLARTNELMGYVLEAASLEEQP
jgi:anti-sigma factor RsiW